MPFILRGVGVLGMDSEKLPIGPRRELWERLGDSLTPQHLSAVSHGDRDIVKARLFQATSVWVDSSCSAGVMSTGRSSGFPLWNMAPARTRATRCGRVDRPPACVRGVDQLVGHGDSGRS
jgi:hypothetical protein